MDETPGEIVCRAWTRSHEARHSRDLTPWDELSEEDKADWEAAALAVIMRVAF
jgi:hypothetical protein